MTEDAASRVPGQLSQWPARIQLAPVNAPWLDGTDLPAAGCAAFAYGNFHADFMRGHATVIGCPKLDGVDCAGKLSRMLSGNNVYSITVAGLEALCCGGLESAVRRAIAQSNSQIPMNVAAISTTGDVLDTGINFQDKSRGMW